MVSRSILFVAMAAVVVGSAAGVATIAFRGSPAVTPAMSEEQKNAREKFFGSGKGLPPIKEGQEMRPRW